MRLETAPTRLGKGRGVKTAPFLLSESRIFADYTDYADLGVWCINVLREGAGFGTVEVSGRKLESLRYKERCGYVKDPTGTGQTYLSARRLRSAHTLIFLGLIKAGADGSAGS